MHGPFAEYALPNFTSHAAISEPHDFYVKGLPSLAALSNLPN